MLVIKYNLIEKINMGTPEEPIWEERKGAEVILGYSEANSELAKHEAWQGIISVPYDNGEPEPEKTYEERLKDVELTAAESKEALKMILSGVTE